VLFQVERRENCAAASVIAVCRHSFQYFIAAEADDGNDERRSLFATANVCSESCNNLKAIKANAKEARNDD